MNIELRFRASVGRTGLLRRLLVAAALVVMFMLVHLFGQTSPEGGSCRGLPSRLYDDSEIYLDVRCQDNNYLRLVRLNDLVLVT